MEIFAYQRWYLWYLGIIASVSAGRHTSAIYPGIEPRYAQQSQRTRSVVDERRRGDTSPSRGHAAVINLRPASVDSISSLL